MSGRHTHTQPHSLHISRVQIHLHPHYLPAPFDLLHAVRLRKESSPIHSSFNILLAHNPATIPHCANVISHLLQPTPHHRITSFRLYVHAIAMRHDEVRPRKRRRPPLRRKTVRWSAKEVDALLAGVRVHGVGKWAAILRHSPVFNGVRTSVDLKDKWRNLTSPVRAAALGNRDQSSNPTHLVVQACASVDAMCDLTNTDTSPRDVSKTQSEHHNLETHPNSHHKYHAQDHHSNDNTAQDPCPEPILDSQPSQEATMSPVHSQEDVQQNLDHHSHDNSSPSKPHSNSDLAPLHLASHESNGVKHQGIDRSHTKSPTKVEPKVFQYAGRRTQVQPLQPPSESSVSPEVLSHPPHPSFPQSPQVILPHTHPHSSVNMNQFMQLNPQVSASQHPASNVPNPQVTAIQQFMNQSFYQSAAVLADYWRRIGHDPTAYGMPVPHGTAIPTHLYPYYAARMGSLYHSDDDDDDDDDHITPVLPAYTNLYSHHMKKSPYMSDPKVPLFHPGLQEAVAPPAASQDLTGARLHERQASKKLKTEQIMSPQLSTTESAAGENRLMKKATTEKPSSRTKPNGFASPETPAPGTNAVVDERKEEGNCQKTKPDPELCLREATKRAVVELHDVPGAETVCSDAVDASAVGDSSAKRQKPDMKSRVDPTGFASVTDDVAYFPDEDFTTKTQRESEQEGEENGEAQITDQGPMGMAPLSFPGLGVEEQRQFPIPDLV